MTRLPVILHSCRPHHMPVCTLNSRRMARHEPNALVRMSQICRYPGPLGVLDSYCALLWRWSRLPCDGAAMSGP
jgi:hypothetical protein